MHTAKSADGNAYREDALRWYSDRLSSGWASARRNDVTRRISSRSYRPRVPGEQVGDAAQVEGAQERVRVLVGPDEDRDVPVPPRTGGNALGDPVGHPVGLRAERLVVQVARQRPGPATAWRRLSIPMRTSSRSGSLCRINRYAASRMNWVDR